jgi:hypothetical protein
MSVSLYGSGQTVIQVVQGTLTTYVSTSSASFVTTGLTATITPQSTTSKILVSVAGGSIDSVGSGGQAIGVTVYRNGSNISPTTAMAVLYSGNTRVAAPLAINYLDSPASTSAQTYAVYFASTNNAGPVYFNSWSPSGQTETCTITLMEIAYA